MSDATNHAEGVTSVSVFPTQPPLRPASRRSDPIRRAWSSPSSGRRDLRRHRASRGGARHRPWWDAESARAPAGRAGGSAACAC